VDRACSDAAKQKSTKKKGEKRGGGGEKKKKDTSYLKQIFLPDDLRKKCFKEQKKCTTCKSKKIGGTAPSLSRGSKKETLAGKETKKYSTTLEGAKKGDRFGPVSSQLGGP